MLEIEIRAWKGSQMPPIGFDLGADAEEPPEAVNDEGRRREAGLSDDSSSSESSRAGNDHMTREEREIVSRLFHLVRIEDWDALTSMIESESCSPWILDLATEDEFDNDASFLHILCKIPGVPSSVISTLIAKKSDMVLLKNDLGQLPLHLVVQSCPTRFDIVRCLVDSLPETVFERDQLLLRPVDTLCQTIIMKEERSKYRPRGVVTEIQDDVEHLWETARILAQAACPSPNALSTPQPIVHTCLCATDFPLALTHRAIRRNLDQLQQRDSNGDFPIHIAARSTPQVDGGYDLFGEIVTRWPEGASQGNRNRQIPLEIAIENGRRWTTGISSLLEAYPGGIMATQSLGFSHYSLLFEKLLQENKTSILFGILRTMPDLLSDSKKGTSKQDT